MPVFFQNLLQYAIRIFKNVVVPEAENAEAASLQILVAHLISFVLGVLASIRFDDEHMLEGDEIDDPRS